MKYIEFPELSQLSRTLTHDSPECRVQTRIEAYSCKSITREKRLIRDLEAAYNDAMAVTPPYMLEGTGAESTPFGPLDKPTSRKTFYLLVSTLNVAFPDYEFSNVRPEHFRKEDTSGAASVLNALSTTLLSLPHRPGDFHPRTYSAYPPSSADVFPSAQPTSSSPLNEPMSPFAPPPIKAGTHPSLYRLLDEHIRLSECEVFSYTPDTDSDPHGGGGDSSDSDDDTASDAESIGSDWSDDPGAPFQADWDDVDAEDVSSASASPTIDRQAHSRFPPARSASASPERFIAPPPPRKLRLRRSGALLWSSHWFFLNRKQKRMLYISVWARTKTRNPNDSFSSVSSLGSRSSNGQRDRFMAWEGAFGAGARALGLYSRSI